MRLGGESMNWLCPLAGLNSALGSGGTGSQGRTAAVWYFIERLLCQRDIARSRPFNYSSPSGPQPRQPIEMVVFLSSEPDQCLASATASLCDSRYSAMARY